MEGETLYVGRAVWNGAQRIQNSIFELRELLPRLVSEEWARLATEPVVPDRAESSVL